MLVLILTVVVLGRTEREGSLNDRGKTVLTCASFLLVVLFALGVIGLIAQGMQ